MQSTLDTGLGPVAGATLIVGMCASLLSSALTGLKSWLGAKNSPAVEGCQCVIDDLEAESSDDEEEQWTPDVVQEELTRLLAIALESPRQLISGRMLQLYLRVHSNVHRFTSTADEVPWQLVLLEQMRDTALELANTPQLSSQFAQGTRALSDQEIAGLPRHSGPEADCYQHWPAICVICQQELSSTDLVCQLPGCHHVFHGDCAASWLQRKGNCPVCRGPVLPHQVCSGAAFPNSSHSSPALFAVTVNRGQRLLHGGTDVAVL